MHIINTKHDRKLYKYMIPVVKFRKNEKKRIHLLTLVISVWWNYGPFSLIFSPRTKLQWIFTTFLDWRNYSNLMEEKPQNSWLIWPHDFKFLLTKNLNTKIRRVLGKNTLSWGKVFLNKQKKKPESHGFTSEKWKT